MQQNAPTLKSCCKLLHWAGKAYLLIWRILLHLAGVVFVIPPGFCYVIAEFPIAYCCIWHGSCLGTLHSVAFSRVLREYPVGVRVRVCMSHMFEFSNWLICHCQIQNKIVVSYFVKLSFMKSGVVFPGLYQSCFLLTLVLTLLLNFPAVDAISNKFWITDGNYSVLTHLLCNFYLRITHNSRMEIVGIVHVLPVWI